MVHRFVFIALVALAVATPALAQQESAATDATASLSAPAQAPAGSKLDVAWTGPDDKYDYISISEPDFTGRNRRFDVSKGNPLVVKMPPDPGRYELRYNTGKGDILARRAIELTPMDAATLDAVASAPAGSMVDVAWTGPDYDGDYLVVSTVKGNTLDHKMLSFDGSPVPLQMSVYPGTYELRYMFRKGPNRTDEDRVLARRTIEVTDVAATLDAPASATVGSRLEVSWTGPAYKRDLLTIARPKAGPNSWVTYGAIDEVGRPVRVKLPDEAGNYELRYIMIGPPANRRILARRPIEVKVAIAQPQDDCASGNCAATQSAVDAEGEVTQCSSRACFDKQFQACQAAEYTLRNMMGSARYRIIGAAGDGCRVELTYLGNPNPAWVGKPLTCTYDDSLDFKQAAMQALSAAFSGAAHAGCEGALLDVM